MSTKSKSLAKSLHTVTAIAAVAKAVAQYEGTEDDVYAIDLALCILGYDGAADPYGLAAKAAALIGSK